MTPQRYVRKRLSIFALTVLAGATLLSSCTRGSSTAATRHKQLTLSGLHVVFLSDQGVILPHLGASFRLRAEVQNARGHSVNVPISWQSSDSSQVSVTHSGVVTAHVSVGSANILVSASRAQGQIAQVLVAVPSPQTLVVPSADIQMRDGTQYTLARTPLTQRIMPGNILVSDNRGGLLGKVIRVSQSGRRIIVRIGPTSLAAAFTQLSAHVESAPFHVLLSNGAHETFPRPSVATDAIILQAPSLRSQDGLPDAVTQSDHLINCSLSSGHSVEVAISGPNISVPISIQLIADLEIHWTFVVPSVSKFELAIQATLPISITTGSVTLSAAGNATATCELGLPSVSLPTPVFLGPVNIQGVITPGAKVEVTANAQAAATLAGPSFSETLSATDGIEYTDSGGWQGVANNSSSEGTATFGSSSLKGSLKATLTPSARVDVGVQASLGLGPISTTLAAIQLAYAEADLGFAFNLAAPLNDLDGHYTGPTWDTSVSLKAAPEVSISGDLQTLLSWIGVQTPSADFSVGLDQTIPISSSPSILVIATLSGTTLNLSAYVKGFDGDTVRFVAIPSGSGSGSVVTTGILHGIRASATFSLPSPGWSGSVIALLDDSTFGRVGLPYASSQVIIRPGSRNAPPPNGPGSTTTSTSSIPGPGPGTFVMSPTSGPPGTVITATAVTPCPIPPGFVGRGQVFISVPSSTILDSSFMGPGTPDDPAGWPKNGIWSATLTVPANAPLGKLYVAAGGQVFGAGQSDQNCPNYTGQYFTVTS